MTTNPATRDPVAEARKSYEEAQEHLSAYIQTAELLEQPLDKDVLGQLYAKTQDAIAEYVRVMSEAA